MDNTLFKKTKNTINAIALSGFAALSTSSLAVENLGESVDGITSQIKSFGNLAVVVMFVFGLFCLYKIVQTVMNREDERQYPLKNIPLYFLGGAIGIGSSLSSELVQKTIFNEKNEEIKGKFFEVDDTN